MARVRTRSAGMVLVRGLPTDPRYLLLRAYRYWDFPKGIIEGAEDPFTAACREVREETTLEGLEFPWGRVYRETEVYGQGKVARYYVARAEQGETVLGVSPELGRPEHDEYRWVAYPAACTLLVGRVRRILDWAHGLVTGGLPRPPSRH